MMLFGVINVPALGWQTAALSVVLAASNFGLVYGLLYQTSRYAVAVGKPLGFTPAESGLGARDGTYDIRGSWRAPDNVFGGNWGFELMELEGGEFKFRFVMDAVCDQTRLEKILNGSVPLAETLVL